MMKKKQLIWTIMLSLLSSLLTKVLINILKKQDPIMHEIISHKSLYETKEINAIITENFIIPGNKGTKINLDESYKKMKKLGYFDKTLLVFNDKKPNLTIDKKYNKLILYGNIYKNNISIIIHVNSDNELSNIKKIVNQYNVSINYEIDNIINNKYCLSNEVKVNKVCISKKMHTIFIKNNITNQYWINTKDKIQRGNILYYNFKNNLNDLHLIINYITSNNYHIVLIDELIKE